MTARHKPVPVVATAVPCSGLHVLVVGRDSSCRCDIASRLVDAGLRVTMAITFGFVEILLDGHDSFDLMVTTQSSDEIVQFGVPQLARSMDADLPILVLEFDTANSPVVVDLVNGALSRWPLRERSGRTLH